MAGNSNSGRYPATQFSDEQKRVILKMTSEGCTLKEMCAAIGCDVSTFLNWRVYHPDFDQDYLRAQIAGFECDAESLKTAHIDIPNPIAARLYSENIRWLLARRAASKYGDRLDLTANVTAVSAKAAIEEAKKRANIIDVTPPKLAIVDAIVSSGVVSTHESSEELKELERASIESVDNIEEENELKTLRELLE